MSYNPLIFGKNETERIVSVEVIEDKAILFLEQEDGNIETKEVPNKFWLLHDKQVDKRWVRLKGESHYKYGRQFSKFSEYCSARSYLGDSCYGIWDKVEALLVKDGYTYFKGMKFNEVSILSFDIETVGLEHNSDSKVLLISNTYRDNKGNITRKMFSYDDYETPKDMIDTWCSFIREMNPSILVGHNIYGFDIPYLEHIASLNNTKLKLGRDGSALSISNRESRFRKDGSQTIGYNKVRCFGRSIIDTMFLAIKYDVGRKYESYRLKEIIRFEGLEKEDRTFYDAAKIRHNYLNKEEWQKIKTYACFAPNSSLISMEDGSTKLIENVQIGDSVISHDGTTQYVYNKLEREYEGEILSFNVEGGRKIHNVTPEHPFYVLNEKTLSYEWVKASDLKVNHLLVKGSKHSEKNSLSYKEDDFWLFGLFQGDGYVRLQGKQSVVVITQHCNEVQNLINTLEQLNYKFSIVKKKGSKAVDVVISNNNLGQKFLNWSGGKFNCYDKKLSKEIFEILNGNKKLFLNFLAGLIDSDGHVRKASNSKSYQMHICISSPHLTNSVDLLSNNHGINLTRQNFRNRTKKQKLEVDTRFITKSLFYELTFFTHAMTIINPFLKNKKRSDLENKVEDNHAKHVRILKIEKENYKGIVYNISVTNTHSYVSNGLISHNCEDGDDSLALYDLMGAPFFYMTQSIPKSYQLVLESATGSQINSIMVRSYLQNVGSIAKADVNEMFQGAVSFGIAGIYRNCFKQDVSSMYPSVMRQYQIYNKAKDPEKNFLELVEYFTIQRLEHKKLAKETGNNYYKDLEQMEKILINSCYGFLGTNGLNYNYPEGAAEITLKGREILEKAIMFATSKSTEYWKGLADEKL